MTVLHRLVARVLPGMCMAVLLPLSVQAQTADLIQVDDDATVPRGDFIRAVVKAVDINPEIAEDVDISGYLRVPRGYVPYIQAAHQRGALRSFSSDLQLGRGISRGQAIQLTMILGDFDPVTPDENYSDVRSGSTYEGAVGVALQHNWLAPLRDNYFGVSRNLTGKDAKRILALLRGTETPAQREEREEQERPQEVQVRLTVPQTSNNLPKQEILQTLWQLVNRDYLYQEKVDADQAAYDAAEALMKSLDDPYSVFMRPIDSRSFQTQINGEVTGIGAQVEWKDDILTIVTPLSGSPAQEAGLKPGDQILKVDGVDITGIGFSEAVEKVRGPKGSSVELRIRRDGIEFDKTVVRDNIKVPEVEISWQQDIAVVKLLQFGRLTDTELRPEMEKIMEQNPKGIILDLRNNPGGLLHAASVVVSNFVPRGSAVAQVVSRKQTVTQYTEQEHTIDDDVPMIVLVNEGSASASEIVAGALQDHKRATVVGKKTFGKGTVQQVLQFNDQSAVKMTIAEWLTPNNRKIDTVGVMPDIEVEIGDRDDQMSRALELLRR